MREREFEKKNRTHHPQARLDEESHQVSGGVEFYFFGGHHAQHPAAEAVTQDLSGPSPSSRDETKSEQEERRDG